MFPARGFSSSRSGRPTQASSLPTPFSTNPTAAAPEPNPPLAAMTTRRPSEWPPRFTNSPTGMMSPFTSIPTRHAVVSAPNTVERSRLRPMLQPRVPQARRLSSNAVGDTIIVGNSVGSFAISPFRLFALLSMNSQPCDQADIHPSNPERESRESIKRKSQSMSSDSSPLTGQSISAAVGNGDSPVPNKKSRREHGQTNNGQSLLNSQSNRPEGNYKACKRCNSLFWQRHLKAADKTVPYHERTNLFCARCFMRLYICETRFEMTNLEARCRQFDDDANDGIHENWAIRVMIRSLSNEGHKIVKAATTPKAKELLEEQEWTRIISHLDRTLNWNAENDIDLELDWKEWRTNAHRWIGIATTKLLLTFFDQETRRDSDWKCGGYCSHCEHFPGQPLGCFPESVVLGNFPERGVLGPEQPSQHWTEDDKLSNLTWDEWLADYDKSKGYDQAMIDNLAALDSQP
ncbi:Putative protein of unknown function [Podospora comata]|uniref:Uncharacterized protein n=1 Tax=Podospora comata TaxID=48703 RepID=A0ABY6RW72_PODCO|nr:Putative protein of unknown function [Podospora comata]